MSDPKYENLYGIARDQPDVYETSNLPESDQVEELYEEESDAVDRIQINASQAFSKFNGKVVDGSNVDFSGRINKRSNGYELRSWELAAIGDKESPFEKYNRLKLEIEELEEEIRKPDDKNSFMINDTIIHAEGLTELSTRLFNLKLEDKIGFDSGNGDVLQDDKLQFSKVIKHLDSLGYDLGGKNKNVVAEKAADNDIKHVQLALQFNPHAQHKISSRLTDLEQKLSKLEMLIRLCNVNLDDGLLNACHWMMAKLSLLDTAQLDSVDQKLTSISARLDQCINVQNSLVQDPDKDKKINELYLVSEKARSKMNIVPAIVERLVAMESMHKQCKQNVQVISHLEALQADLTSSLSDNKNLLTNVKESLTNNLSVIKNSVEALKSRVDALAARQK